jgi:hypothetical protein
MQGVYDHDAETMRVTLSYDNVMDLYNAMSIMGRGSHNVFQLSKQQMDGTTIIVEVCKEQAKRDWEGR